MKRRTLAACLLLTPLAIGCGSDDTEARDEPPAELISGPLTRFVDPLIGTGGWGFGVGSAYPGPALPFAMIHAGPESALGGKQTGYSHCSGYSYQDDEILGFSHTRLQGTGVPDLGNILIQPTDGFDASMAVRGGFRSTFDHSTEAAAVGYYGVTLDRWGVRVELTSARRAALHRYGFPAGADATLVIDPTHFTGENGRIDSASARWLDGRLQGHVHYYGPMSGRDGGQRVYYAAELDVPVSQTRVWRDGVLDTGAEYSVSDLAEGSGGGLVLSLDGASTAHLRIAISFVSEESALANLRAEAPDYDFDAMRERAEAAWEPVLDTVRIAGGTEAEQRIFYSALYRSFLMPTLFTDADGSYRGVDGEVHSADGFEYYTDFSLWDTFRTLHPLMVLIAPQQARDFAVSMVKMIEQGGAVPRWALGTSYTNTMIGSSADIVFADTYLKGITDFDAEAAYAASKRQAMEPKPDGARGPWRSGIESYVSAGYVPEEVSVNLEYAYDDWALGNLARALGKDADSEMFASRATNWNKLWDAETAFLRPRNADGSWTKPFSSQAHGGPYTEGNAWHWTWYVPHDGPGLIEAFESTDAFYDKLLTTFEQSQTLIWVEEGAHHLIPDQYYWHSNEPMIHAAFLFNDAGRWDTAQHWLGEIARTQYRDAPDGLPGNDDGGTMSAWYIFNALGFYPIAGGTEYWVGRPLFSRAVVHRVAGDIEVRADAPEDSAPYARVTVDGDDAGLRIDHAQLASGAQLRFAR